MATGGLCGNELSFVARSGKIQGFLPSPGCPLLAISGPLTHPPSMSASRDKADVFHGLAKSPLIAKSGHSGDGKKSGIFFRTGYERQFTSAQAAGGKRELNML